MIACNTPKLRFVSDCTEAQFFKDGNRAIALIDIGNGLEIPLSVSDHKGQVHVSAHLPHKIIGKASFAFYRELAGRGDGFNWWVDPSDGECKYTVVSESRSAQEKEVDAIILSIREAVAAAVDSGLLGRYEAISSEQSLEDMKAYDMAKIIGLGGD